jgi:hypothetical protein
MKTVYKPTAFAEAENYYSIYAEVCQMGFSIQVRRNDSQVKKQLVLWIFILFKVTG